MYNNNEPCNVSSPALIVSVTSRTFGTAAAAVKEPPAVHLDYPNCQRSQAPSLIITGSRVPYLHHAIQFEGRPA